MSTLVETGKDSTRSVIWDAKWSGQQIGGNLRNEEGRFQPLGFQCLYIIGIRIRTQHNNRLTLPIPGTDMERILFYIDCVENLAKSASNPRVSWI